MNININIPWPGWKVVRVLGHGGYGTVYEIERDIAGIKEKAALKVVSIPKDESEIDTDYGFGLSNQQITEKYKNLLDQYKNEYQFMMRMKGQSYIVSCDDFYVEQQENGVGYNVYIRMELLMPLTKLLKNNRLSEDEIIRLGKDICKALMICEQEKIIHRDIKPANILRSKYGSFKLGDFGVSRVMEHTTTATSVGTQGFAAQEVYHNKSYGKTADIYSLGIVLYWLLNNRKMPLVSEEDRIYPEKIQMAILRRYNGEQFAPPENGSEELKQIVMKACAYEASDRYQTAGEMLEALESLKSIPKKSKQRQQAKQTERVEANLTMPVMDANRSEHLAEPVKKEEYLTQPVSPVKPAKIEKEEYLTQPVRPVKREVPEPAEEVVEETQPRIEYVSQDSVYSTEETGASKKKKSKVPLLIGAVGAIAVLAVGIFLAMSGGKKTDEVNPTPIPIEVTATPTLEPTATPMPEPTATPTPKPTATPTPEPIATPIPASLIPKDISVGDIITFGRYEQDIDLMNGAEPIEWNVLDVQDGKALLISKYGLDAKAYNEKSEAVTWETCTLRQWLNHDFMESAFIPEEADIIQTTIVTADANPNYNTDPGNDTKDQVFLLSIKEAQKYFVNNEVRRCAPTKYAIAHGAWTSDDYTIGGEAACWWWLRSPGFDAYGSAGVSNDGSVDYIGDNVFDDCNSVRPALWIELDSDVETDEIAISEQEAESDVKDISTGDIITFGRYEQDNDLTNGAEPIEWNVLDVQDGKALLISKYGLDAKRYNEKLESVTWETCTLRKWLNTDFVESAFSSEEAGRIQATIATADSNPKSKINPGNDTEDQVFLLSINEAERYWGNAKASKCAPTQYASAHGAMAFEAFRTTDGEATCWWWLRSPGDYGSHAAGVDYVGLVDFNGDGVYHDDSCVRPALWINLAS